MEEALKLLRAYSKWIGKTSNERELINVIKMIIEMLEKPKRKIKMKLFILHIFWKYSAENFEYGIIKAENAEEAEKKGKQLNPDCIDIYAYELEFDNDGYCSIYKH
jgi:hypothetical protein